MVVFNLKSLTIYLHILYFVNHMELIAEVLNITAGGRRIAIISEETAGILGVHSSDRIAVAHGNQRGGKGGEARECKKTALHRNAVAMRV